MPLLCLAAGCGTARPPETARGFDLALSHPSPLSTYMQVSPGTKGAALPSPDQINTVAFSKYLRARTGCVLSDTAPVAPLGSAKAPAAYMVPISCP